MSSEQSTTATFSPPLEPTPLTGHKRKADNETLPDASVEEVLVTEVDVQGLANQALFPPTTSANNYSNHNTHNNGTKQQQYTVSDMLIEYSKIHHTIVEFTHKCQQLYQLYQNSGASDQQPQQQHHHNTLEMMGYITKMFEVGGQDLLNELSFMHHAYITNNTTAPILNTLSRSSSNPLNNSTNTSILQNAINSSNSNIVSNRSLNSSSNTLSSSLNSLTSSSASAAVANATNGFAGQLALIPSDLDSSTGNLLSSSQNNLNEAGHSVILQGICFEFPAFCCWDDQKNRIVVKSREVSDQHSSVTIQAYKTKGIADENTTLYFKDGEEKEQEIKETNNVFVIQVAFTDNTKAGNNKKVIIRRGDATTAQTIPIRALKKSQYNFIRNQTPKKVKEI